MRQDGHSNIPTTITIEVDKDLLSNALANARINLVDTIDGDGHGESVLAILNAEVQRIDNIQYFLGEFKEKEVE